MTDDIELTFERGGIEMSIFVCGTCGSDDPNHHEHETDVVTVLLGLVELCDDCRKAYEGPAYYTFFSPAEAADLGEGEYGDTCFDVDPHNCTGNICPTCAGPYLTPDNENDPRRPATEYEDRD